MAKPNNIASEFAGGNGYRTSVRSTDSEYPSPPSKPEHTRLIAPPRAFKLVVESLNRTETARLRFSLFCYRFSRISRGLRVVLGLQEQRP